MSTAIAFGQKKDEADFMPQNLEEALSSPVIPAKQVAAVRSYMERQFQAFPQKGGVKVEIVNDYIIRYTIPASDLFEPNGFNLVDGSADYLSPILSFLRHHGKYRIVLAMHSDDTGSADYRNILCENRILSIYDYYDSKAGGRPLIYGFSMGGNSPLRPNDSYKSREQNRRLEIYIAPGPTFMNEFKAKR